MPIHGYPGNIITANPTAPTSSVASGVWTTEQQLLAVSQGNWPGYEYPISRSLRFNSADSAYLNRTPASASNRKTWTWSGWVKISNPAATSAPLFTQYTDANTYFIFGFNAGALFVQMRVSNANAFVHDTDALYRDASAWYHIVYVLDTTQATDSNRAKLYVNGTQVTLTQFTTNTQWPALNTDYNVNTATSHRIGYDQPNAVYFNGYMTEVNFIDGQALTPSSFGLNDPETGVWSPKQYTGTYGTNGFYLNFSDNSGTTSTTLGKDSSGNGNNWTPNNFSVTAGAGNDSMVDSPTSYGTDTGVGGEVRGNYSTLNPLFVNNTYPITYSNGNLDATRAGGGQGGITNTLGMSSGKWYWEVVFTTYTYNIGITTNPAGSLIGAEGAAGYNGGGGTSIAIQNNGVMRTNGTTGSTYTSWTTGDIMGIALDMDGGNLYFYKNGTAMNSGNPVATSLTGSTWFFITSLESGASLVTNFGQRAFAYTAPSGFKALCTQNLPTPTIGATSTTQANYYFDTKLWSGNSSTQSIALNFAPDLIWNKSRNAASGHSWWDVLRGTGAQISSSETDAETTGYNAITSFSNNAISLGADNTGTYNGRTNETGRTYVGWVWNAGDSTATNTSGTISAQVRASTTAGFSIVVYTGNGIDGATVGHGLGVVPSMVIQKRRDGGIANWRVWHSAIYATSGVTDTLFLNSTAASGADGDNISGVSSTTFTTRGTGGTNPSGNSCVAYVFAAVPGYSAFGSYTGNGSADGPFVYTGFRPMFILFKQSSASGNDWYIYDAVRSTYNVATNRLFPNSSAAEATNFNTLDILSNGWKVRDSNSAWNASGATYIYMAFAESPFKYALAR
jgi:hypothetical protein